jgi:hypothetical protein
LDPLPVLSRSLFNHGRLPIISLFLDKKFILINQNHFSLCHQILRCLTKTLSATLSRQTQTLCCPPDQGNLLLRDHPQQRK